MSTSIWRTRSARSFSSLPLASALATALLAGLPGPALADTWGARVSDLTHWSVFVRSDGENYTSLRAPAEIIAEVTVEVDVGSAGAINSWTSKLGLWNDPDDPILYFHDHAISESYAWPNRPDRVRRIIHFNVPFHAWEAYVVVYCNQQANRQRAQGFGNALIFSEDQSLPLRVAPWVTADTSGAGSGSPILEGSFFDGLRTIQVICEKTPGLEPPEIAIQRHSEAPKVVNSGLNIVERSGLSGVCKIRLDAWITTDHENQEVRYRYKDETGKTSQVWRVNSGPSRTATASHWYDIGNNLDPESGLELPESGRVKLVGVSHDFESDWADYRLNCVEGGPNAFTASLPPKLSMSFTEQGQVTLRGHVCPKTLKLTGLLEGRGKVSGKTAFVGPRWLSPPRDFDIDNGQKVLVGADYEIDWDEAPAPTGGRPLKLVRSFDFNATNSDDKIVASLANQGHEIVCEPIANNSFTATLPPKLSMRFVEQGKVRVGGWLCPQRVKLVGLLEGRSAFSGQAAFVGQRWFSKPQPYSLDGSGDKALVGADYELPWHKLGAIPAGESPRWEVRIDFNATGQNNAVVASLKRQLHVAACLRPKLNPALQPKDALTMPSRQPADDGKPRRSLKRKQAAPATTQLRLRKAQR